MYLNMNDNIEYQIYIGFNDSQANAQIVKEEELEDMISEFFRRKKIDFSLMNGEGGFFHQDGTFAHEKTLIVNIIGQQGLDIIKLAKSLSMFMNQECSLVTKSPLKTLLY